MPTKVVPYIGTWIETTIMPQQIYDAVVVPYIGTWIETERRRNEDFAYCRTLYRYVD